MRHREECVPCSKRQACRVFELAERSMGREAQVEDLEILGQQSLDVVCAADPQRTPADVSSLAILLAHERSGCDDPFLKEKRESNTLALSLYSRLKQDVKEADDPLHEGALLAVSGNIIDLGIQEGFDIEATLAKVRREGFVVDCLGLFRSEIEKHDATGQGIHILYICDNAGEILFDRIFIETLLDIYPQLKITASVNSGPILNDALMEDAVAVGLTEVVTVIENGHPDLGTVLEHVSPEFLDIYKTADLIIAKGQANFETLDERGEPIFFVLKAKCEIIADILGVKLYDAVFATYPERRTR